MNEQIKSRILVAVSNDDRWALTLIGKETSDRTVHKVVRAADNLILASRIGARQIEHACAVELTTLMQAA